LKRVAWQINKGGINLDLDLLLTSNSKMLNLSNAVWIPGGGIWNYEKAGDINFLISGKDKLVSMVCSGKNVTKLHRVRRSIFDSLLFDKRITLFGPPICNPVDSNSVLRKHFFSIVIENHLDKHYFTEKILNCFAQGTIPVYLGSQNVDNYFDNQGIIHFSSIQDLKDILPTLTRELYNSKISSIESNHHVAMKSFSNIENYNLNILTSNYLGQCTIKKPASVSELIVALDETTNIPIITTKLNFSKKLDGAGCITFINKWLTKELVCFIIRDTFFIHRLKIFFYIF
jgi:hypothetical protein